MIPGFLAISNPSATANTLALYEEQVPKLPEKARMKDPLQSRRIPPPPARPRSPFDAPTSSNKPRRLMSHPTNKHLSSQRLLHTMSNSIILPETFLSYINLRAKESASINRNLIGIVKHNAVAPPPIPP